MKSEELTLVFLLHDLGMIFQRTGHPPSGKYRELTVEELGNAGTHSKWSASIAQELGLSEEVQKVILYHHKPEIIKDENAAIARILNRTSSFYSGRVDLGAESLLSVFSEIKISENNIPRKHFLPIQKLDIDHFHFPVGDDENNGKDAYESLWNDFKNELAKLGHDRLSENLYYLIKKYTLLIPSASKDISLFDHIKTTTAVATCLYRYLEAKPLEILEKDEKFFLVISGGISGIQRFIYRVASPQEAQEGMAKRLRGRSFYITLFNDAVASSILDKLGLPEANLIWCSGGNFLILAPNTQELKNKLEEIKQNVNNFLLEKFNSELFLSIIANEIRLSEMIDFGKLIEGIDVELSGFKKQKFVDNLEELFAKEEESPYKTCPVCANSISNDGKLCINCDDNEELGKNLAYATHYLKAITNEGSDDFDAYLFGIGYKFIKNKEKIIENICALPEGSKKIQVFKLNDTEFINEDLIKQCAELNLPVSFGFTFLANTVPDYERQVLSFTNLAELSKGSNRIGILKMDVDNLGKIFAHGFSSEGGNIARISTTSSMLDFYFSGILNRICENYYFLNYVSEGCEKVVRDVELTITQDGTEQLKKVYRIDKKEKACKTHPEDKIPEIYINYAGGDDLLIIGPWDSIIYLAKDIRQKFREFTCNNVDISISGGVFISGHKFPIGKAASLSGKVLEKSKNAGKDRISVFGETVPWDSKVPKKGFNDLFNFSVDLEDYTESKRVSKSFIYSLLRMWHSNYGYGKQLNDKIRIERKSYIPILKYKLVRTVKDKDFRKNLDKTIQKMFPWIKIPVSWVSLRTR